MPTGAWTGWLRLGSSTYILSSAVAKSSQTCISRPEQPRKRIAHMQVRSDKQPLAVNQGHGQQPREPVTPQHRVCSIFLDADDSFFRQWQGHCPSVDSPAACAERKLAQTQMRMLTIAHQAMGVFEDPVNIGGLPVSLRVAGLSVLSRNHLQTTGSLASADEILQTYQAFLAQNASLTEAQNQYQTRAVRGALQPTSQEVCINFLFTHRNTSGSLGAATTASTDANILGGLCETYVSASPTLRAVNTAFTTTMAANGNAVSLWQSVKTMAHELGHSFGASHDCCLTAADCSQPSNRSVCSSGPGSSACYPNATAGGVFLMSPFVSDDLTGSNALRFSPCSIRQMHAVVAVKGSCLALPGECGDQSQDIFCGRGRENATEGGVVVGRQGSPVPLALGLLASTLGLAIVALCCCKKCGSRKTVVISVQPM